MKYLSGCICILLLICEPFQSQAVNPAALPPYVARMLTMQGGEKDKFWLTTEEIVFLSQKAQQGDRDAAIRLFLYYKYSLKDNNEINKYIDIAAGDSCGVADYFMGSYEYNGSHGVAYKISGVWQDRFLLSKRQIGVLSEMAANNDKNAAYRLFEYYEYADRDEEKLWKYLTIAAENGHGQAQYVLACLYIDRAGHYKDQAFEQYELANKFALKSLESGVKEAKNILDAMELATLPIDELFALACKADNDKDIAFLLYRYFKFVLHNRPGESRFLFLAANNEHPEAQSLLAYAFYNKRKYKDAKEWALKAKNNGYKDTNSEEGGDDVLLRRLQNKGF